MSRRSIRSTIPDLVGIAPASDRVGRRKAAADRAEAVHRRRPGPGLRRKVTSTTGRRRRRGSLSATNGSTPFRRARSSRPDGRRSPLHRVGRSKRAGRRHRLGQGRRRPDVRSKIVPVRLLLSPTAGLLRWPRYIHDPDDAFPPGRHALQTRTLTSPGSTVRAAGRQGQSGSSACSATTSLRSLSQQYYRKLAGRSRNVGDQADGAGCGRCCPQAAIARIDLTVQAAPSSNTVVGILDGRAATL